MLNRVESKIMSYIFDKGQGKNRIIFTPKELLNSIMPKVEITAKQLDIIMTNLVLDDYIECDRGVKDGRLYYLVSLTLRGAAFDRERKSQKRARLQSILWKVALTVGGAVLAFVLAKLFAKVFG